MSVKTCVTRRAAVLMELVIALAIFASTAMLTLSVMNNSYAALQRSQSEQLAVDLARSKLAELDAGLLSIGDLQEYVIEHVGSIDLYESMALDEESDWWIDVYTEPTEFDGLTLVEITVTIGEQENAPFATLRELIRLRDARDEEYEQDELLDGLEGVE